MKIEFENLGSNVFSLILSEMKWSDFRNFCLTSKIVLRISNTTLKNDDFDEIENRVKDKYLFEDMQTFTRSKKCLSVNSFRILSNIYVSENPTSFTKLISEYDFDLEKVRKFKAEHSNAFFAEEVRKNIGGWERIDLIGDVITNIFLREPNKYLHIRFGEKLKVIDFQSKIPLKFDLSKTKFGNHIYLRVINFEGWVSEGEVSLFYTFHHKE